MPSDDALPAQQDDQDAPRHGPEVIAWLEGRTLAQLSGLAQALELQGRANKSKDELKSLLYGVPPDVLADKAFSDRRSPNDGAIGGRRLQLFILIGVPIIAAMSPALIDLACGRVISERRSTIKEVDEIPSRIGPLQDVEVELTGQAIEISQAIVVETGGSLKVSGHGSLRFGASAFLESQGVLQLRGESAQKTITLEASSTEGWAGVQLIGKGASGSSMEHCIFEGGRGRLARLPDGELPEAYEVGGVPHFRAALIRWADTPAVRPVGISSGFQRVGGALTLDRVPGFDALSCTFQRNASAAGGAVLAVSSRDVRFLGCTFRHNIAAARDTRNSPGGALHLQYSAVTMNNAVLEWNQATDKFSCGGAIYAGVATALDMTGSRFSQNRARYVGGAIYAASVKPKSTVSQADLQTEVNAQETRFEHNVSGSTAVGLAPAGGTMFLDEGTVATMGPDVHVVDGTSSKPPVVVDSKDGRPSTHLRSMGMTIRTRPDVEGYLRSGNATMSMDEPIETSDSEALHIVDWELDSKCFGERVDGSVIDTVVIHYISAIKWDEDPTLLKADQPGGFLDREPEYSAISGRARAMHPRFSWAILDAYEFSSHYLIGKDGQVYRLVPDLKRAFHAGKSSMPNDGREDVNQFSIGVEIVATHPDDDEEVRGDPAKAYTEAQYRSLDALLASLRASEELSLRYIVGHDEIAPDRKTDPGPGFDWSRIRTESGFLFK